jgi:hypothetical protein
MAMKGLSLQYETKADHKFHYLHESTILKVERFNLTQNEGLDV